MRATTCCDLSILHQRTVAVEMAVQGRKRLLRGRGSYEVDPALGRILRIDLPSDGDTQLVIEESSWQGEITPVNEARCEYMLRLN